MAVKSLSGAAFVSMLRSGAANLETNRKVVNDLNVFPVPDGDTGDNMSMTINSAALDEALNDSLSLEKSSEIIARDMLLGARGNSGVILSRMFKGLSLEFEGKVTATLEELDNAFHSAVREAYAAVSEPVEGTILTVLKDSVRFASGNLSENSTFESYFDDFNSELKRSLDRTPELLPKLKEAGVVDSGGVGLAYIFEGFFAALSGSPILPKSSHSSLAPAKDLDISLFTEDSVLEYGYCTELIIRLQTAKISLANFDMDAFKEYLDTIGNSVVAFREDSIVKIHVHTKTPGKLLSHCQSFGEFLKVKIENMTLQHNATEPRPTFVPKIAKPHKSYALVAVAAGDGIKSTFEQLGVDVVIDGGQTMNPSTNDFLKAFDDLDADHILVYPNNKNIILSAEQAANLYEKSDVIVVPTKSIGDAYMAISQLDTSSSDTVGILYDQQEIIDNTTTALVSKASRSTTIKGTSISSGDYIGYIGDDILASDSSRESVLLSLAEKSLLSSHDLAILIYGSSVDEFTAKSMKKALEKSAPMTEIVLLSGGQPVNDYIIILS